MLAHQIIINKLHTIQCAIKNNRKKALTADLNTDHIDKPPIKDDSIKNIERESSVLLILNPKKPTKLGTKNDDTVKTGTKMRIPKTKNKSS